MRPIKLFHLFARMACVLFLAASATAHTQTTTARITGIVTDTTGAAISNTTLTVHSKATGIDRTTTSDAEGHFVFFSLPPSEYSLRASHEGFADTILPAQTLSLSQEFVWTPQLAVSGSSTVVEVSAQAVALDTSSARIGGNVTQREVANLPINGRQISQLYLLVPGATNAGSGTFDNIHFSGRSVEQNIIRVDGIENTGIIDTSPGNLNGELTSVFRLQQSMEAIQEFRVDSSNYPAEMGTGTGGQISFLTKSGTNKLHGDAFEYVRNDFFDARNAFNRRNVAGNSPKFRLNNFGGSIGGPLLNDKLFFFGTYEGLRQVYVTPYTAATLSNYARSLVKPTSTALPLLAAFPNDPTPLVTGGSLSTSVTVVGPNRIQEDFGMFRLDYHLSDRFQMYARYHRDQGTSYQTQDISLSRFGQVEVPQNGVIALNQVWGPRVFNETKFGYNGIKMRVTGTPGASPNADLSRARIAVAGLTNVGSLISLSSSFNGIGAPYTGQSYNYIDNLSLVRGAHNLKFGVEIRPLGLYNNQLGGTTYTYASVADFTNNLTSQIQFYGDLSDLSPFTGLSGNAYVKQNYYIGYAQDEWKVTPSLTLSYGLRYEYFSPLHETRNKNVVFDMTTGNIIPKDAGDWYKSSTNNYGPRVGLVWAPQALHNQTVIRLGGGIYYGPGQTEDQIQPEANDRVTKTFGTAASTGKTYPISPANDVYATYDINSTTLGYQPRAFAPQYKVPERVTTYTASIQQQLPGQFALMIGYVGSTGRNLFLRSITNLITGVAQNPTTGAGTAVRQFGGRFAEIDYKTSGGTDQYHGLQSTLQRRFTSGVSFGAQYTWAHELGTSSGSNEATTSQLPIPIYGSSSEYGRGTFDIRHTLNLTTLYDLPFGKGRTFNLTGPMNVIAGGWQMGGIVNFRSGVPMDVLITRPDLAYVGNAGTAYAGQTFSSPIVVGGVVQTTAVVNVPGGGNTRNIRRPNIVPGVNPYLKSGKQFLNPAAFSTPAPGTFGNARRNDLSGPNLAQLDLTLTKRVQFTERVGLEFHADAYNVLNHANYANPGNIRLAQSIPSSTTLTNTLQPGTPFSTATAGTNLGTETSTVSNQIGIGTNRQIQLAVKLAF
ncbi:TonB-dependent receptor [Terriglobus saanensis]|uniref:TonB-dependent transporter Oar-like beta-barrel domain-containing protein n=1 Tax=Terriglobus saanensis (strain ATCC BAA-1853 / DSM 23119 / SP1PR4) TaxID=401053 RepID=E8V7L6_TERSS|nr:carboxypeptidase regulatory-like domain-containing protein [Terriglobus saanensis]ADV81714.1 hypothetical protein AciPR4_0881 [Terriglobus saanensis SP1PR4]